MNRKVFCVFVFLALFFPLLTIAEEQESDDVGESRLQREFREALNGDVSAGQCRLPGVDNGSSKWLQFPTIERSRTGAWRRNLKLMPPEERVKGTGGGQSISPEGPVQGDALSQRRWVPGYKPRTPEQKQAYDRWLQASRRTQPQTGRSPASDLLEYAVGNKPIFVDKDEEITHTVHHPAVDRAVIDLRTAERMPETPKQKGPASDIHRSGLTNSEYILLKELASSGPETEGAQIAEVNTSRAPITNENLDGIFNTAGGFPPDPVIAVSSNFLIEAVNSRFRVWDITVSPPVPTIPEITFNTLFSGVSFCSGSFDPYIAFDEVNDRWVIMTETIQPSGNSYLCIAGSRSADPSSTWNTFSLRSDELTPTQNLDFPKIAVGLEAIYITGNNFLDNNGPFAEIHVWALDKAEVFAVAPPANLTVAEATLTTNFFTAYPAQITGFRTGQWPAPGTPQYFLSNNGGTNRIWQWSNPFGQAPTIYGTFASVYNGAPPNAPESGGGSGNLNDTNNGEWSGAEVRGDSLWASRATFCNLSGGSSEACIDWMEVDISGGSPSLVQQQVGGSYGSADDFRYYPDISVDRNGNVAIAYTKSSDSTFTEIWATGREFSDPPGTLQNEVSIVAGSGEYTDGFAGFDRWGDYSSMVVDPDGCEFWFVGEYSNGGNAAWRTRLASFQFASCSIDSALNLNKAIYTCDEDVVITVTDSTALTAAAVASAVTITTDNGGPTLDTENTMAGDWIGTNCVGAACETWTATFPTNNTAGSDDDGQINVLDGGSITFDYTDPHGGHVNQNRVASVDCESGLDDGGFLIAGGCEAGTGTEIYRDYLDAGEFIAYTFGLFNPATSPALTDVVVTLNVTGPAATAGLVTVYNPTINLGSVGQGSLTAAVFNLSISPGVDSATFRLSTLDFEVSITSLADGFTTPQLITQQQFVQGDDNIVAQSECWNFESGVQGWQNERYVDSYTVAPFTVNTIVAPWTRGSGCNSETRDDYPEMTCDVNGSNAFKLNPTAGSCNNFPQTSTTLVDDALFSPIFGPNNTGNAANGQPWQYQWLFAEWFYRSEMETTPGSGMPTSAWGHFFEDDYQGINDPAENETDTAYSLVNAFFFYADQDWDSATPWDENSPPANYDGINFPFTASGDATPSLQWRWALEVFDTDFVTGASPTDTPATAGLIVDDMNLVYDQYHAMDQIGVCAAGDAGGVVSFDQFVQQDCPSDSMTINVIDGNAAGATVTVTSTGTGDSETIMLSGAGPLFTLDLIYSTLDGAGVNDGILYVTPTDTVQVSYDDISPVATSTETLDIDCPGGDVVVNGLAGLSDNGDSDAFADTNETAEISIQILNNTSQDLINVVATITTDDPDIDCILKDTASFGTIAAGGGVSVNDLLTDAFRFKVANAAECVGSPPIAPTVTFTVFISADNLSGPTVPQTLTLSLDLDDVPGTSTATENFNVLPATWQHELGPGDDNGVIDGFAGLPCGPYVDDWFWRATGGNTAGGFFLWENEADNFPLGVYRDQNDAVLLSPVYKIGATSTTLSFNHEYKFADALSGPDDLLADGMVVDFSINGGVFQKLTTLPYDGPLIWNTYCNPLCNGTTQGTGNCFSENTDNGENVFNPPLDSTQNWTNVNGAVTGLTNGDTVQFRWRFGSMNSAAGFPGLLFTDGGYGLDNVAVTNVLSQVCDTNVNPNTGCGVTFDSAGNLVERCGDGDLIVEPTEDWEIDITLKNVGQTTAVNTVGDLVVSGSSGVAAVITMGNPGSFGTLAGGGGEGTASFRFTVDAGAMCVSDLVFDMVNIADNAVSYDDSLAAFSVQIGQVIGQELASQDTDPLTAESALQSSTMSPAFSFMTPVASANLNYSFAYNNPSPSETATQQFSPIQTPVNGSAQSPLFPATTLAGGGAAISATIDWQSLTYGGGGGNITNCSQVDLITPNATTVPLKGLGVAIATPYNVLSTYNGPNGGPGTYQIIVTERQGGGCNGVATLTLTTLEVTGSAGTGNWTTHVQVSLFDGTTSTVLKAFGVADSGTHDVAAIYNAGGPGSYEVRIQENGGGGVAEMTAAAMTVDLVECDLGCMCATPVDPPNLRLDKSGADLVLTFDDAGTTGNTYNIYRASQPNTTLWGAPIATGVTDQDGGTPGIQWTDIGGGTPGVDFFYRVTESTCGGESPL